MGLLQKFIAGMTLILMGGSLLLVPALAFADETSSDGSTPDASYLGDTEDLNDTSSFDLGQILTTEGQNQSKYFGTDIEGRENVSPIALFILDAINFITRVMGAIAMLLIIIGGLYMVISEGDEDKLTKGKGILTAAIIGLIISMFSYIIVRFVQSIFYLQGPGA